MKRLVKATCGFAAGFALAAGSATPALAQFVAVNNYAPPAQPQAQYPAQTQYPQQTQVQPQYQPQQVAAPGYAPRVASTQMYAPPTYGFPRMAQANELPAPAETVTPPAQPTPAQGIAPAMAPAPTTYNEGYGQPTSSYAQPTQGYAQPTQGYAAEATTYPAANYGAPASGDCATGNCGVGYTDGYNYGAQSCDVGAPACEAPACAYPSAPRRQWFAGIYGLYLDRAGDSSKRAVAYLEDDQNAYNNAIDYYPMPGMPTLFTADANDSGMWGAEVRFGSTFGCDPCNCMQPYAWEVGYWALDNDGGDAYMNLPGTVATNYPQRIYTLKDHDGLVVDRDGAGGAYMPSNPGMPYDDYGNPADGDIYASTTRILGIRVRQRFTAQNLELNFWRFGTPTAVGCGAGACAPSACDTGCDPCGSGYAGYAGYGACAPCRPPRRFFINGVCGVRYMRIDDDFGMDWQFTTVDGTGMPNAGEPNSYMPMLSTDDNMLFSTYQADNELVGFQLGSSMNWLCGCRWNLFADTNFGIYGNNASVYKRVYGGGGSMVYFDEDDMPAEVTGSETSLAYVGELRAGIGYQVTCNCRITAAYRFIGIGGVALGVEEFQNTNWANSEYASHIDTNNSIILHGLQTGVEYKF
jgi:hypothetical protein